MQAIEYMTIVKEILGEEWLNPSLMRIGASSLANSILNEILILEGKKNPELKYISNFDNVTPW